MPPIKKKGPGRNRKQRRIDAYEAETTGKRRNDKRCSRCGEFGHNVIGCPNKARGEEDEDQTRPVKEVVKNKGGRPKKIPYRVVWDPVTGQRKVLPTRGQSGYTARERAENMVVAAAARGTGGRRGLSRGRGNEEPQQQAGRGGGRGEPQLQAGRDGGRGEPQQQRVQEVEEVVQEVEEMKNHNKLEEVVEEVNHNSKLEEVEEEVVEEVNHNNLEEVNHNSNLEEVVEEEEEEVEDLQMKKSHNYNNLLNLQLHNLVIYNSLVTTNTSR
ncbi:hypothetical protein AQUCO_06600028v1 [Aquilegia coerulea]|uniref:CCHC-type domain-containing protein n=1 Tax=Aquilegia coerulea TaxID=218851 RepID=A0A2G5CC05_AQUCA|nr:hypothetical protein AQUCO_06600028v1 [Aquilegia coerulea]